MDLHTNTNEFDETLYIDDIEEESVPSNSDDDTLCLIIQDDLAEDEIEETLTISDVEDDVSQIEVVDDEGVGDAEGRSEGSTQKKAHSCPKCEFKGKSHYGLRRHLVNKHSDKPYTCSFCDFVTDSVSTLRSHIKYSHLKDPQKCNKCDFQSFNVSNYNQHMLMDHKDGENYPCSKCSHKAGTYAKLKRHERVTHPAGYSPTDCNYCAYVGKKPYLLRKHILMYHSNKLLDCRHCSFSTREFKELEAHVISNHTDEKPFVCPHCMYGADSFAKLKHHYRICIKLKFLI